jgi:hypothetical protein
MIEKKYINEIYTMKQYLKMFHCMFPNHGDNNTEVTPPQLNLIVEGNECSAMRIPRAPQEGGKWTSSNYIILLLYYYYIIQLLLLLLLLLCPKSV